MSRLITIAPESPFQPSHCVHMRSVYLTMPWPGTLTSIVLPVPRTRPTVLPVVRPTFSSFVPTGGAVDSTLTPTLSGISLTLSAVSVVDIRVSQTLPKPSPATIIPTARRFLDGALSSAPPKVPLTLILLSISAIAASTAVAPPTIGTKRFSVATL